MLDLFEDPTSENEFEKIEEQLDQELLLEHVYKKIETKLTIRERQILCMVYGLLGEDVHTVSDVAKILRVTESNVYKTLKRATNKLREIMDEEKY